MKIHKIQRSPSSFSMGTWRFIHFFHELVLLKNIHIFNNKWMGYSASFLYFPKIIIIIFRKKEKKVKTVRVSTFLEILFFVMLNFNNRCWNSTSQRREIREKNFEKLLDGKFAVTFKSKPICHLANFPSKSFERWKMPKQLRKRIEVFSFRPLFAVSKS